MKGSFRRDHTKKLIRTSTKLILVNTRISCSRALYITKIVSEPKAGKAFHLAQDSKYTIWPFYLRAGGQDEWQDELGIVRDIVPLFS